MTQCIMAARCKHTSGHIVAVTHGDPIAFTALWAAGRPNMDGRWKRLRQIGMTDDYPSYAAILSLSFNGDGERPSHINYQRPTEYT